MAFGNAAPGIELIQSSGVPLPAAASYFVGGVEPGLLVDRGVSVSIIALIRAASVVRFKDLASSNSS